MTADIPVRIFDTTLRDGEQAPGAGLTVSEKLEVARQLVRLNVDVIEAGFPAASPGDFEAVKRIAKETKGVAVAGLARCRDGDPQRGVEALRPAEKPHLHVFISTSDIHLVHKLRMSPRGGARGGRPLGPLRARGAGARRRDRVQRRGRQPQRPRLPAARLRGGRGRRRDDRQHPRHRRLRHPQPSSASSPARSSSASARAPSSASTATTTWASPTANTLAAVQAGARQVEVTDQRPRRARRQRLAGGGRHGPAHAPHRVRGRAARGVATEQISNASRLVSYLTGFAVQPNKAIVGRNAFAHESGIHQDGVLKNPLTYEIMTPQSVGLAGSRLSVGKLSGRRGLQGKLQELGHELEGEALDRVYRRPSRWPTPRRRSPTPTSSRSSRRRVGRGRRGLAGRCPGAPRGLDRAARATAAARGATSRSA